MIPKSIRWQLQLWYGLILLAVLAGFGVTAYQLESGRQWRRLDAELMRRMNSIAGALLRPERPDRGGRRGAIGQGVEAGAPLNERMGRFNPDVRAGTNDEPRPPSERDFARDDREPRERPDQFVPFGGVGEPPFLPRGERMLRRQMEFRLTPGQAALFDEPSANGFYFVVWSRHNEVLASSTNAPADISIPRARGVRGIQPPQNRADWREVVMVTPPGERLLVGCSIKPERNELRVVALKLTGVGGVILAFGLAGGWWLATRAIRPIRNITDTAKKISGGDLSQRISMAETESELGQLAGLLNSTFSRLDAAFRQQQQFTSDAAHELRTPVSVILTQTQTALHRERSSEEYRGTLEACQRSAQRMRRLIESLLALARLDAGQESMRRSPVDLARIVSECVDMIRPLAAERRIEIDAELESVECAGDSDRLAQVVTNLLSNAVHFNREEGRVHVSVRKEGTSALLIVADTGVGIAPEHQANVFKRFYRVDAARTTTTGRSGLGLAISRAIVDAHGGTMDLSSEPGRGTTFTVRLPIAQ